MKNENKDSDLEKVLKIKAVYDLATIASEVRDKNQRKENDIFQDTLDKIDIQDYKNYLEKDLFPQFIYQKEKGMRNFASTWLFFVGMEVAAFKVLPLVWQTIFIAVVFAVTSFVFLSRNFMGIYERYKEVWINETYENESEAMRQIVKDAYDKTTGIGNKVYFKYTAPRRLAELEKQMRRVA